MALRPTCTAAAAPVAAGADGAGADVVQPVVVPGGGAAVAVGLDGLMLARASTRCSDCVELTPK